MLAVSPLRNNRNEEMESFSIEGTEFADFTSGNLLDSIDFDDLFVGISDGDLLPDLEMDPEILAEFSVSNDSACEMNIALSSFEKFEQDNYNNNCSSRNEDEEEEEEKQAVSDIGSGTSCLINQGDEIVSKRVNKEAEKGRKSSSAQSKNPSGKRKVKVDWTPELHRRFVQAVEQLGVDKAVPSRILELMGIDCLTRHNIASHLQKYRSHRKHLLAREAEAASWSQRRHMYGGATATPGKRDANPWIAPTMGFPPVQPMPPHFRPLHVWGHPSMDQSFMHTWPKHLSPPPPPPHAWPWPPAQPPPNTDLSFWHPHQHVPTPGTPFFPPHVAPTRFPTPAVPGLPPPPAMYKVDPGGGVGLPTQTLPQPPSDVHPSKESVDAAITDVLSKPWLPLPLGLKPPSTDSVMVELQLQGISKIPPTTCSTA